MTSRRARAGHRLGRRRARRRTWSRPSSRATPTRSWRPRSSIATSTPSPRSRPPWPRPACPSASWRRGGLMAAPARPGARSGRRALRRRTAWSRPSSRMPPTGACSWSRWQDAEAHRGHAAGRARSTSTRGRAAGSGARARRAATPSRSCRWSSTATRDAVLIRARPAGPDLPHGRALLLRRGSSPAPSGGPAVDLAAAAGDARSRASPGSRRSGRPSPSAPRTRPAGSYTSRLLDGGRRRCRRARSPRRRSRCVMAAKDDAAAEATGRAGRDQASWPASWPTCSTTRSCCARSAACRRPRSSRCCAPATR